jgi:arylsulfatase A-like enzyme
MSDPLSKPSRRQFIREVAGSALVPALAGGVRAAAQGQGGGKNRPPNVLVIFPDQWRRQALGCYGDPLVRTPNLDRLAEEGIRFDRCYTNNPVCSPARATLLTGRYPHQTGLIQNNLLLPASERTLAECLGDAGYATGYIGKWHLDGPPRPGFVRPGERRQGFDWFAGFNRGHWYHNAQYFTNEGELLKPEAFESFYQTDLAIDFMKQRQDAPFFLFLAWGPPHMPYVPPEGYDRFRPEDLEWRPNVPDEMREDAQTIKQLCGYYGLCEALDHEVGRLTEFLGQSGLADNTLVLFTADHGDMHGCHGLHYKGHPEEESVGIPLIARLPGAIPAASTSAMPVGLLDIMPSVLGLCGADIPDAVVGRDLSPVLRGGTADAAPVYAEGRMTAVKPRAAEPGAARPGYGAWRAVITPQHKLAVDVQGEVRLLVDLENDPYEMSNLANQPEAEALQKELLGRLREIGKETGDPFPEPVPAAPTPPEE